MDHRILALESQNRRLEKLLEEITPKIHEFDKACEINIPKAEAAHKATAEISKAISDINHKINEIIKDAIRVDQERKERDINDNVFKDSTIGAVSAVRDIANEIRQELASLKGHISGKKEGRSFFVGSFITVFLAWNGWLGLTTNQNSLAIADIKAITKNEKDAEDKVRKDEDIIQSK